MDNCGQTWYDDVGVAFRHCCEERYEQSRECLNPSQVPYDIPPPEVIPEEHPPVRQPDEFGPTEHPHTDWPGVTESSCCFPSANDVGVSYTGKPTYQNVVSEWAKEWPDATFEVTREPGHLLPYQGVAVPQYRVTVTHKPSKNDEGGEQSSSSSGDIMTEIMIDSWPDEYD